jgi:hypothetical protein
MGMVLVVHAVFRSLGVHGVSVELPGLAHGKVADVDHLLDFTQSFLEGFAHLVGHQGSQWLLISPELMADLADNLSPPGCRHLSPLQKGLVGGRATRS